ncbi:MAG: hypothetical protein U1E83_10610 [Methylotetracoccus sp.]
MQHESRGKKMRKAHLLFGLAALATASNAVYAHGGTPFPPYLAFVGFNAEPSFTGEPNTLDLILFYNPAGGKRAAPVPVVSV